LLEKTPPAPISPFIAKFRRAEFEDTRRDRPNYLRWLHFVGMLSFEKSLPNSHEKLLLFHDASPEVFLSLVHKLCFLQAATLAALIVLCITAKEPWDIFQWVAFAIGVSGPLANTRWLLPKVIGKMVIVTNIENMKDERCVQNVTFDVKRAQLFESFKIWDMMKAEAKIARICAGGIPDRKATHAIYDETFTAQRKQHVEVTFHLFDANGDGTIHVTEMQDMLFSMGIPRTSGATILATRLVALVDDDHSGDIDLDEFKILMTFVLMKESDEQVRADLDELFTQFDIDRNGSITIKEMQDSFEHFGHSLDEELLAGLVYQVFRRVKLKLDRDEFFEFMHGLETIQAQRV